MSLGETYEPERKLTFNRFPRPIPKKELVKDAYYVGICRNAQIARWDGEQFWHWRLKFGARFIENIKHREDDEVFDVFDAWARVEDEFTVHVIEYPKGELNINVEDEKIIREN